MDSIDRNDEWVIIKDDPFEKEDANPNLRFNFCWNYFELKLAITCLSRQSRTFADQNYPAWSRLFSKDQLQNMHSIVALVQPDLHNYFPDLTAWPTDDSQNYLFNWWTGTDEQMLELPEGIIDALNKYFHMALDLCGKEIFLEVFFDECLSDADESNSLPVTWDRYFERMSEFALHQLNERVLVTTHACLSLIGQHEREIVMQDLVNLYIEEDKALNSLHNAMAALYNFKLQPFLDLREVIYPEIQKAKSTLKSDTVGPRIKQEANQQLIKYEKEYLSCKLNIQELKKEFFSQTAAVYNDYVSAMEEDRQRVGTRTYDLCASDRLYKLASQRLSEKLQVNRSKREALLIKKAILRRECSNDNILGSQSKSIDSQLHQMNLEILNLQEEKIRLEMRMIKGELGKLGSRFESKSVKHRLQEKQIEQSGEHQVADLSDEDEFYEAAETEEQLHSLCSIVPPEQVRLNELNAEIASINAERSKIRNKMTIAIQNERERQEKLKLAEETRELHRKIKKKKEEKLLIDREKTEFWEQERRKTLERLAEHKKKRYPTPATLSAPKSRTTGHESPCLDSILPPCMDSMLPDGASAQTTLVEPKMPPPPPPEAPKIPVPPPPPSAPSIPPPPPPIPPNFVIKRDNKTNDNSQNAQSIGIRHGYNETSRCAPADLDLFSAIKAGQSRLKPIDRSGRPNIAKKESGLEAVLKLALDKRRPRSDEDDEESEPITESSEFD